MIDFINLHHHDNFSLRCSLGNIDDAIKKIKEYNQPTLAVTNYNELSGWVQQYFSCRKNEIKPILAVQMMVSNYRVHYQENSKLIDHIDFCGANKQQSFKLEEMTEEQKVAVGVNWHLLLYAKNEEGYYNIIKIHNDAQLHGVYEHPRTTNEFISKHGKGVVCVIPSVNGEVINDIENDREKFAIVKYRGYKNIFEEVYLELTIAEDDYYIEENNKVIQFAKKYNIPCVIGINSHYINKDDEAALKALMSIKKGGDVRKEVNVCPNMSFKSTEEIYELFERKFKNEIFTLEVFEEALNNNHKLADSIDDFELNTDIKMPKYPNAEEVLRQKAWEGLKNRGKADDPRYVQRLKYELDNVIKAGFADYFLFLEDVCRYCNQNGIARGFGRGSGGGCIVLYALYIFDVDPVKYNLLFERFLDFERMRDLIQSGKKVTGDLLPDVDVDSSSKAGIMQYLRKTYGEENVCLIGNRTNFTAANLLQDLGRVYGIEQSEILQTTKSFGDLTKDDKDSLTELSADELQKKIPSIKRLFDKYPQIKHPFDSLRGLCVSYGVHASGVLVKDKNGIPLIDMLPIRLSKDGISTAWIQGVHFRQCSALGFIKMDLLEIKAMNFINQMVKLVNERYNYDRTMYDYIHDGYLNDKANFKIANSGDLLGVWQLDSSVAKKVIKDMGGLSDFNDISATNALIRPAALQNKLPQKYRKRKFKQQECSIPKCLQDSFGKTYGLPIFQQAAYHSALNLAHFDKVNSYLIMKKLYKNKLHSQEEINYWRNKFIEGSKQQVIHEQYDVQLENGKKISLPQYQIVKDTNGNEMTMKQAIANNIDIDENSLL